MGEQWTLARAALAIMGGMLAGSVAGFVRAFVIARMFGAGAQTDALFAALAVPQTLYDQLLGAAAVAIFIPALSRSAANPRRFWTTAHRIAVAVAIATAIAAGCLEVCAGWLMPLLVSGFRLRMHGDALSTSIVLARILAPGLILMGLSGVGTSALYALGKRTLAAGSIALYHLGVIGAALTAGAAWGIRALAVGALVGWGGQVLLLTLVLFWQRMRQARPHSSSDIRRHTRLPPNARNAAVPTKHHPQAEPEPMAVGATTGNEMLRLSLPVACAGVAGIAVQVADLHFKSSLPEPGGLSAMQYATQLIQFPVGLLAAAIALAVLPAVSRETSWHRRHEALSAGIRLGFAIMLPATIGLMTLGSPIVALVFQRGSFAAHDTTHTAAALLGYAPQLPFVALSQILMLAYFARRNTFVPALINVLGLVAYIALAVLLLPRLTILGLALANSISLALQAVAFAVLLSRRWPRLRWRELLAGGGRIGAAGALMALTIVITGHTLSGSGDSTLARAAQVLIPGTLGLTAYVAALSPWSSFSLRSTAV
jgi:putative peptidoglycan lipid II flippase